MAKWLPTLGVAVFAYILAVYALGYGGASLMDITMTSVVFVIGTLAALKWRGVKLAGAWFFNRQTNMYIAIVAFGWLLLSVGIMGFGLGVLPGPNSVLGGITVAQLTVDGAPSEQVSTGCQVSEELQGKEASLEIRVEDHAANNPASTTRAMTSIYTYRNGNSADDYLSTWANGTQSSGFSVGDVLHMYPADGDTYGVKKENLCIDRTDMAVTLKGYQMSAETDISLSVLDEDEQALTAAGNSTTADYDVTLGSSEEKRIIVKVKNNVANKALNFKGFATAVNNDIDSLKPTGSFTKATSVNFLENVDVNPSGSADTETLTFAPYVLDKPVLFTEWDSEKYSFTIKAGSNDPSATDNDFATLDAGIVCTLDAEYSRGADGKPYLDFHNHDEAGSEADVGITETFSDPVGGNSCVVLEGE